MYTSMLPDLIKDNEQLNITHFEMVNMIIAIKLWGHHWKHQKVSIKTDNMAVVQICTNGYTRDMTLATYVRILWLITAKFDIELVVTHIKGKDNIMADTLSRWSGSDNDYKVLGQCLKNPKWHNVNPELFDMDDCI